VSQQASSTFVVSEPSEIVQALILPKAAQVVDPFHVNRWRTGRWTRCAAGCETSRPATAAAATTRSTEPAEPCPSAKERLDQAAAARLSSLLQLGGTAHISVATRVSCGLMCARRYDLTRQ
jgi:hypothetical protein